MTPAIEVSALRKSFTVKSGGRRTTVEAVRGVSFRVGRVIHRTDVLFLDEADALSDRLAIMDHGRIVAEGDHHSDLVRAEMAAGAGAFEPAVPCGGSLPPAGGRRHMGRESAPCLRRHRLAAGNHVGLGDECLQEGRRIRRLRLFPGHKFDIMNVA